MNRFSTPEIVRRALLRHGSGEASDATLLNRYTCDNDHAAFADLVERYGPLVWRVCRQTCADCHSAEDAFHERRHLYTRRLPLCI